VRPSGTEPKAKVYALAGSDGGLSQAGLAAAVGRIDGIVDAVLAEARALADAIMAPMLQP
jgi:phosphomannomutase